MRFGRRWPDSSAENSDGVATDPRDAARAAVEATTLRFHESTVAFADVCPRHLADYAPKSTKPCGDALLRGLVA